MIRAYGLTRDVFDHPLSDLALTGVAVVAAVACATADRRVACAIALLVGVVAGKPDRFPARVIALTVIVAVIATWRTGRALEGLTPRHLGAFEGWVRLVDDPSPYARSTRALLEIDGERFEMWARGRASQIRVRKWRAGEMVQVLGERVALRSDRQGRVAWQHIVGEFELGWASDVLPGGPLDRASNKVRRAIERAGSALPGSDGALYRGLVVGDDRGQPASMLQRFRASGLSHLTAVSGQNVSFILAAAGPLLTRLRPRVRWVVTVGLIGWFVSLTRFEPSILRAGAMGALSATAFVLGRERAPFRLLTIAVASLFLIDPLLVRSVGFWLSTGATVGVTTIGPRLATRLARLGALAMPLGVTLGAQVGVAIPSLMVFGRLPLVSIAANILAIPAAGFVMLYGLPAGLVAGSLPAAAPFVMFPCRIAVRWVDTVAGLGERLEPGGALTWIGWAVVLVAVAITAARHSPSNDSSSSGR